MKVEIISTGDEVLTGFITDTNVSWLCQELLSLGIQPTLRHTVVFSSRHVSPTSSETRT